MALYTVKNYKTKKAVREAVQAGERVAVYQPGGLVPVVPGKNAVEGPHYPDAHTWYASAVIADGVIVSIK